MNKYNITAQIYNKFDNDKQTIFMNEIVSAPSKAEAYDAFHEIYDIDHEIVKVYSVEQISKGMV
jgi:hypothetical protein